MNLTTSSLAVMELLEIVALFIVLALLVAVPLVALLHLSGSREDYRDLG